MKMDNGSHYDVDFTYISGAVFHPCFIYNNTLTYHHCKHGGVSDMNKHDKKHFIDFVEWMFQDFMWMDWVIIGALMVWGTIAVGAIIYGWGIST